MIQRIQTVFLFLALVFIGLLFFIPFASLITNDIYSFSLSGISSGKPEEVIQQPYWLTAFGAVTALLIFIVIFQYKNRKLQMKLTLTALVLALGLNGAMYFVTEKFHLMLTSGLKYSIAFVFPMVAAVLLFLAYRSIKKDEQLIRSLDRLR